MLTHRGRGGAGGDLVDPPPPPPGRTTHPTKTRKNVLGGRMKVWIESQKSEAHFRYPNFFLDSYPTTHSPPPRPVLRGRLQRLRGVGSPLMVAP